MTISVRLFGRLQEETAKPRVSHNRLKTHSDSFSRTPTECSAEGAESDHGDVNKENRSSVSEDIRSNPAPSARRQTLLHESIAKVRHLFATVTEAIWFNEQRRIVRSKRSARANWSWYTSR
jgi:hypothetical protein